MLQQRHGLGKNDGGCWMLDADWPQKSAKDAKFIGQYLFDSGLEDVASLGTRMDTGN